MDNIKGEYSTNNKKYFWSPAVTWEKKNGNLQIEIFAYPDVFADLFPDFYYLAQNGVYESELVAAYQSIGEKKLRNFIKDLVKKKILVDTILTPQEIFFKQLKLFQGDYDEEIMFDAEKLSKFKEKELHRHPDGMNGSQIQLIHNTEYHKYLSERETHRMFATDRIMSFQKFSNLLSIYKQKDQRNQNNDIRYYYASAGGLYPLDIYLYVKADRVENLKQGIYYYSPVNNSISAINENIVIPNDVHFYTNREIFDESAISIFYIFNSEASMPKYGGMGYYYALIDTGIMVEVLTQVAEENDIGLCSIGDMNFQKIEEHFHLSANQVLLHTVEVGMKKL